MSESITSDNIHLSKVIQARSTPMGAVVSNPLAPFSCTDPKILEFITAATAPNTRRGYQSDLRHFLAWGGLIPATSEQVARYLADHAATHRMTTLTRRLAGIRTAHVERGFSDPTKNELVRLTLRGIGRQFGRLQRRAAALSIDDLSAIVASLGQSTKDVRDAAILLIGFAGAFRRSELVAIDRHDINFGESGLSIRIPRSKTDQEGHGRAVSILRMQRVLCPVTALEHWLQVSRITEGPLFRPVTKAGKVLPARISSGAIACILKQHAKDIGRDPIRYSGHSLRAGFVTAAASSGVPLWRIKAQTGHLSDSMLERYIREGELSSTDAAQNNLRVRRGL